MVAFLKMFQKVILPWWVCHGLEFDFQSCILGNPFSFSLNTQSRPRGLILSTCLEEFEVLFAKRQGMP